MTAVTGYVFDNAAASPARRRMAALEALYDPVTRANLDATGARAGWGCLEAGAGGGSVARWLAGRGCTVLATDLNPSLCPPCPGVEVRRHDITRDPLPEARFDLVHARLLLCHLPERNQVLKRMVAALRPGGWLAVEDFDNLLTPPVLGNSPAEQLIAAYSRALIAVFTAAGADPGWARHLPGLLSGLGLTRVHAEGHLMFSPGGSPGAVLQRVNAEQARDRLTATGLISDEQVTRLCRALTDPAVSLLQPVMICVRGQVPGGDGT